MTLLELLNLANEVYPDGFLKEYYHDAETLAQVEGADPNDWEQVFNGMGNDDTLAECIVIELIDAYRVERAAQVPYDDALLSLAAQKLDNLVLAIARVAEHLRDKYREVTRIR